MKPIVGIGEILWDVFPDGRKVAGGAPFNFAFHCQQLGHDAVIVSRVGDDDLGRELREEVKRLGMTDEFIQTDYEHPTGTVRVTVDDGGQPSYEIVQNVAWDYIKWNDQLLNLSAGARALCFGTLASRSEESRTTITTMLANTPLDDSCDFPQVFDINLRQEFFQVQGIIASLHLSDTVKLNDEELRRIARLLNWHHAEIGDLVGELIRYSPSERAVVIVTCGSRGSFVYTRRTDPIFVPGIMARVVDTVGAGDSFTAAMVCLHLEGRPLQECARFANHYAARVCEHQGGTPRIDVGAVKRECSLS